MNKANITHINIYTDISLWMVAEFNYFSLSLSSSFSNRSQKRNILFLYTWFIDCVGQVVHHFECSYWVIDITWVSSQVLTIKFVQKDNHRFIYDTENMTRISGWISTKIVWEGIWMALSNQMLKCKQLNHANICKRNDYR